MSCGVLQGENDEGEVTDVCSYSLPSSILGSRDFKLIRRISEGHSG